MKNTLGDLNNHLFAQIERLGDEDLKGDKLTEEIGRAKAVTQVATQIVLNGRLALDAIKAKEEYMCRDKKLPPMLRDSFLDPKEE